MISKKYSLQEAFEKRLLLHGEEVWVKLLYKPYKTLLLRREYGGFSSLSLASYFGERGLSGVIHKNADGSIDVTLKKDNTSDKTAELVASKLLSDDMYNIKATHHKYYDYFRFTIVMDPNIIVRFEGEDEIPFLELPPHVAYTC